MTCIIYAGYIIIALCIIIVTVYLHTIRTTPELIWGSLLVSVAFSDHEGFV